MLPNLSAKPQRDHECEPRQPPILRPMKTVASYPTRLEADVAKVTLDAVGIPSVVIGIGVAMEGGSAGVQLLVPVDRLDEALKILAGR